MGREAVELGIPRLQLLLGSKASGNYSEKTLMLETKRVTEIQCHVYPNAVGQTL